MLLPAADALMKEHEAEIRDHMLALLSKKTVEELTDPLQRDPIKKFGEFLIANSLASSADLAASTGYLLTSALYYAAPPQEDAPIKPRPMVAPIIGSGVLGLAVQSKF